MPRARDWLQEVQARHQRRMARRLGKRTPLVSWRPAVVPDMGVELEAAERRAAARLPAGPARDLLYRPFPDEVPGG